MTNDGVDTHLDVHVAAALDPLGGLLGTERFETNSAGYKALLGWLETFGDVTKIGIEGTGSYGFGVTRYLRRVGIEVIEVDRPNREERRRSGKSDPLDAVEAARAALGGRATGKPKSRDGSVEAIRVLVVAKRSARQARVKALIQVRHLGYSAPEQLRCRLEGLSVPALVAEGSRLRPTRSPDPVPAATKASLSSLAHRIEALDRELAELDARIEALLVGTVPELFDVFGVGPDTAAALVMAAGDNPDRLHSEAAWAHCAVSHPSRRDRARPTAGSRPTTVPIARPTARCGASSWSASHTTPRPSSTSSAESRRERPSKRSSAS
jgi:transposase